MANVTFTRSERKRLKTRIELMGPSGSGKTYTALMLAKGQAGEPRLLPGGQQSVIALIDTEGRRSEIYADEFTFNVFHLDPPFSPERYIEAITAAEAAGMRVLIIDSGTHEWEGAGGILDTKDRMPDKNEFAKWKTLTPRHDKFVDKLIRCDLHMVLTVRAKDEYVLEPDGNGKQKPRKVGKGPRQRDGLEYEMTCSFLLDQETHVAQVQKDNTHLFENRFDVLTEKDGAALRAWAESGAVATPRPATPATPVPAAGTATAAAAAGNGHKKHTEAELLEGCLKGIDWLLEAQLVDAEEAEARKTYVRTEGRTREELAKVLKDLVAQRKAMELSIQRYAAREAAKAEAAAAPAAPAVPIADDFQDDVPGKAAGARQQDLGMETPAANVAGELQIY